MENGIANVPLIKQLLHHKTISVMMTASEMSIKHKRKIFSLLRKQNPVHCNYLLIQYSACTLGDFCTTQVILNDGKRKFKEHIDKSSLGKKKILN